MNLLYIIFNALVANTPILPDETRFIIPLNHIPLGGYLQHHRFYGYDERFSAESNEEEKYRLSLFLHYFQQLESLKSYHPTSREDVLKNPIITDVLRLDEITPVNMRAGGLFDDWERDIL